MRGRRPSPVATAACRRHASRRAGRAAAPAAAAVLRALLVLAAALALPVTLLAAAADRSQPPRPGPVRPLKLPPVERHRLSNGLPVVLVGLHEVPVVNVALVVKSGAAADPPGREGLALMTAELLDEGAGGKDALALADAIDFLGASLETEADWDFMRVTLRVPVARLAEALPLAADVALRPDFPTAELERLRKEALTDLLQARDQPNRIASAALQQAVFGREHRYGRPRAGDAASLAALTADELRGFHARHFVAGNAALVVVGDVTATLLPRFEAAFGSLPRGEAPRPPQGAPKPSVARSVWLVDKPGAAQSALRVGQTGPGWALDDYHASSVMNTLLGGSFTSRLNDNLREQHGYAYGAGSSFQRYAAGGLFLAAANVQTDATAPAVGEVLKELERIREPATAEEVERARNYLALGYAGEFETSAQVTSQLVRQVVYGLPDGFFEAYVPMALAVDAAALARAAQAHVDPRRCAIVVVGDRATVEGPLRALGLGELRTLGVGDVLGPAPKLE